MPFAKRSISPVNVSQHRLPPNVRQNELECVANGTLANLIRQLSSLSRHAEDIFGELYREAVKIEHKTNTLFNRIDRLAVKVTQLDSKIEEVSLQDLHLRKPFKSSSVIDQQSLSRHTMPAAMADCYSRCDRPPELDKLDHFRDDDKCGLKFYTDPDYFFALWREEMLKDAENVRKVHKTKNPGDKRRKQRQAHEQRQRYYDKSAIIRQQQPVDGPQADYYHQQLVQDETGAHPSANGRIQTQQQYMQQQTNTMRPESLELQYGTSGYGSADSTASSLQHFRLQQQQQHQRAVHQASLPAAQYAMINKGQPAQGAQMMVRNQQAQRRHGNTGAVVSDSSSGTTPTAMAELNQASPRSLESTESYQSRGYSRPSQPPPAPPPTASNVNGQRITNGDLPNRLSDLRLVGGHHDVSPPPPPPPPMCDNYGTYDRSMSPDLPPPPPPLASTCGTDMSDKVPSPPPPPFVAASPPSSTVSGTNSVHNGSPISAQPRVPPPPPPPPPPMKSNEEKAPSAVTGTGPGPTSTAKNTSNFDPRTLDARSDLLKAIKQGIQLKKVDRQEEKARDDAAVEKGHDVAAILKRRMEDVMGRSESEGSASDFEDDWDD